MPAQQISNATIIERIESLRADIFEIKAANIKILDYQLETMKRTIEQQSRLDVHEKQIEANTEEIKRLTMILQPIIQMSKIVGLIGGALGLSVIALIWALITGQVTLVFP